MLKPTLLYIIYEYYVLRKCANSRALTKLEKIVKTIISLVLIVLSITHHATGT